MAGRCSTRHLLTRAQLQQLDLGAQFAYADHGDPGKPYRGRRTINRLRGDDPGNYTGENQSKTGCTGDHWSLRDAIYHAPPSRDE